METEVFYPLLHCPDVPATQSLAKQELSGEFGWVSHVGGPRSLSLHLVPPKVHNNKKLKQMQGWGRTPKASDGGCGSFNHCIKC